MDLRSFAKSGKERVERKCQRLANGQSENENHKRGERTKICYFNDACHLMFGFAILTNCPKWKNVADGSLKKDFLHDASVNVFCFFVKVA